MARGVAVVTADVGGQRELVAADCGVLIPPAVYDVLAGSYTDAVHGLISDLSARRAMGERARARVSEAFRVDQMGRRMDALLRVASQLPRSRPQPACRRATGPCRE